jgi:hypothetical protein
MKLLKLSKKSQNIAKRKERSRKNKNTDESIPYLAEASPSHDSLATPTHSESDSSTDSESEGSLLLNKNEIINDEESILTVKPIINKSGGRSLKKIFSSKFDSILNRISSSLTLIKIIKRNHLFYTKRINRLMFFTITCCVLVGLTILFLFLKASTTTSLDENEGELINLLTSTQTIAESSNFNYLNYYSTLLLKLKEKSIEKISSQILQLFTATTSSENQKSNQISFEKKNEKVKTTLNEIISVTSVDKEDGDSFLDNIFHFITNIYIFVFSLIFYFTIEYIITNK